MAVDAGKVAIRPRGAFSSSVTYEKLDLVTYHSGSYIAKQTTTGNLPTDTSSWLPWAVFEKASMTKLGLVKVDGTSITADADGTIHGHAAAGVNSFNGRDGDVIPEYGDYDASMIGYNNSDSVLSANRVGAAIDEIVNKTISDGNYVTIASYSALQTALTNKVATMKPYTIENMVIVCSAVFTEFPSGGSHAVQIFKGGGNNDFSAIIQGYHTGELKYISCLGGTWNFRNVSFKEDTATALTVTSGTTNYTIVSSYAYRYGNHIHAEVYGTYGADVTTANQVPFFTISGIKAPSAAKYVGTVIIMDISAKPILTVPALAHLGTNKYIYERATNNLSSGYRVGFIVDYFES